MRMSDGEQDLLPPRSARPPEEKRSFHRGNVFSADILKSELQLFISSSGAAGHGKSSFVVPLVMMH